MWKNKKVVFISIVAAVVVIITATAGMAFAATSSTTPATRTSPQQELYASVAKILGIDQAKLESAFKQASKELEAKKLDESLKQMIADGKITQDQADKYKAWLQSKPDVSIHGAGQGTVPRQPR